jgi:hypothetical protein
VSVLNSRPLGLPQSFNKPVWSKASRNGAARDINNSGVFRLAVLHFGNAARISWWPRVERGRTRRDTASVGTIRMRLSVSTPNCHWCLARYGGKLFVRMTRDLGRRALQADHPAQGDHD